MKAGAVQMKSTTTSTGAVRPGPLARVMASLALAAATMAWPALVQAQAPFANPEMAADAMIKAIAEADKAAMARLLGKTWQELLPLKDEGAADRKVFVDKARQSRVVNVKDGKGELVVGADAWPLPIPLAQGKDGQWRFDPAGGKEAVLDRIVGNNERSAMQVVLAYLDAQREYALADRNGDGVLEYAQKLVSSPGKRDGLIWSASLGDESPLGEEFLPAKPGSGYHGYRFKILTRQGAKAATGKRQYLIGKRMVTG